MAISPHILTKAVSYNPLPPPVFVSGLILFYSTFQVFVFLIFFIFNPQSKNLTEACAWKFVIDHVLMAWAYVKATPVWDNPTHNNLRKSCFKSLASNCMLAFKKSTFSAEYCQDLRNK